MDLKLDRRRILVTGGSGGIGSAICEALSSEGCEVLIHYNRNPEAAERLKGKIRAAGGNAEVIGLDLQELGQLGSMVEETGAGGNLDGLVNCAGVYEDEGMEDITENQWNRVLNINLKAPVFLTQQIRKILNNGSSIVNVSSVMGLRATKFGLAYQAAKSSLIHVTRSMALSYAPDVRVNCIAPGYVTTEMNRDGWENEDFRKKIEYVTPMGRWGAPADIGPLAVFLLSPVSSFVTGSLFPVDGGIGIR